MITPEKNSSDGRQQDFLRLMIIMKAGSDLGSQTFDDNGAATWRAQWINLRGVARNLLRGGGKTGCPWTEVPQHVQAQSLGGVCC